jgi:glycosyltransferase involved in cell wall biosynthesis
VIELARRALAALGGVHGERRETGVSDVNFFFATPDLGGAERVHADIVRALADQSPSVFFTEQGRGGELLADYAAHGAVFNLARETEGRVRFYLRVGSIARALSARKAPLVFGGHSDFFYRMMPGLAPHVRCIDIVHNLGWRFDALSLPHAARLHARVVVSQVARAGLIDQYRARGLPQSLDERIHLIENCCDIPSPRQARPGGPMRVLFVGRGDKVKRVHLAARVATACKAKNPAFVFTFVGDVQAFVNEADLPACAFMGQISDRQRLSDLYARHDVLLLTSSTEGFPLVVMEAMAHGCVPLCADVGGLRLRLVHGKNAMLFEAANEDAMVASMAGAVLWLYEDTAGLEAMSAAARATAVEHFSRERFTREYRALLLGAVHE